MQSKSVKMIGVSLSLQTEVAEEPTPDEMKKEEDAKDARAIGHDASHVENADVLVVSSAIRPRGIHAV